MLERLSGLLVQAGAVHDQHQVLVRHFLLLKTQRLALALGQDAKQILLLNVADALGFETVHQLFEGVAQECKLRLSHLLLALNFQIDCEKSALHLFAGVDEFRLKLPEVPFDLRCGLLILRDLLLDFSEESCDSRLDEYHFILEAVVEFFRCLLQRSAQSFISLFQLFRLTFHIL